MRDKQTTGQQPKVENKNAIRQICLLGFIFFVNFTAFLTIQVYATKMYGAELNANILSCLYAVFTISCLFSPIVINYIGAIFTIALGIFGYAVLVSTGLVYFTTGYAPWLVVAGGGICGIGAALLWTGQGSFVLEYTNSSNRGLLTSIFYFFFQGAAVVGGILSSVYFSKMGEGNHGNAPLYVIFLVLILSGSFLTIFLRMPKVKDANASSKTSLTNEKKTWKDFKNDNKRMFSLVFHDCRMLLLIPIFVYSGMNQPYQLSSFSRYFDSQALGVAMIVYYVSDVAATLFIGRYMDCVGPKVRKYSVLAMLAVLVIVSFSMAIVVEIRNFSDKDAQYSLNDKRIILPLIIYSLFGMTDGFLQVFNLYNVGSFYSSGPDLSASVGFYKFIQSLGWSIGFALMPSHRVPPLFQACYLFGLATLGIGLALFIRIDDRKVDDPAVIDENARLINEDGIANVEEQ